MAKCMQDTWEAILEEQLEEITVLQSIFGDDLQILQTGDTYSKTSFALKIKVNIPYDTIKLEASVPVVALKSGLKEKEVSSDSNFVKSHPREQEINLEANSIDENDHGVSSNSLSGCSRKPGFTRSVSLQNWHVNADIQYLTPIHLTCSLPPLYPTECPPDFSLACLWLTISQLQVLQGKLMQLWMETPNLPIIFTWADWLQNDAYEYLQLGKHLVLKESDESEIAPHGNIPRHSQVGVVSSKGFNSKLETVLLTIFEHDIEMQKQAFCQNTHLCEICFDEKGGTEFQYLQECKHFFCIDCVRAHCQLHIDSGNVLKLLCPSHDCETKIPPEVLQMVLDDEKFERWERLLLSKTLDVMGGVVYCPRCNIAVIVDEDESLRLGHCANCFYAFCTECYESWHHGLPCHIEADLGSKDEAACSSEDYGEVHVDSSAALRARPCQGCSVKMDKAKFYYLYKCSHFFCTKCLREHIERHINSCCTYTLRIQCINQACKALISEEIIQGIVDEATLRMRMCRNCSVKMDKAKFHYLYQCKHFFCTECLKAHIQWHIDCRTLNIRCLYPGCTAAISVEILRGILDEETFRQYEKLFRVKTLEDLGVTDVDICPRCTMAVVFDEEESSSHGLCAYCSFEFCTECFEPWHHGKPCFKETDLTVHDKKNDELKGLFSKSKENDSREDADRSAVTAVSSSGRQEREYREQKLSNLSFIRLMRQQGNYQSCPRCRMAVERISGCDMMHCSQCTASFCWTCGMCSDYSCTTSVYLYFAINHPQISSTLLCFSLKLSSIVFNVADLRENLFKQFYGSNCIFVSFVSSGCGTESSIN